MAEGLSGFYLVNVMCSSTVQLWAPQRASREMGIYCSADGLFGRQFKEAWEGREEMGREGKKA